MFFVKYVFLSEISIKKLFRVNCFIVTIVFIVNKCDYIGI